VIRYYMMNQKAFQDYYPDELSHCYGCGRLNEHGLKIRSYWDGQEAVAVLEPMPYHIGIPGYVYGGLIASVIDCHCIGTASAAALRAEGRNIETSGPLSICHGLSARRLSAPHADRSHIGDSGKS